MITGSSSGIGRSLALEFGRRGYVLHLVGRNIASLDRVQAGAPAGSRVYNVDFQETAEVARLSGELSAGLPGVDVLVCSAGLFAAGSFDTLTVAEFDRQWLVNVRAPYVLIQALLPALRAFQGQVVFINSLAGQGMHGAPRISAYTATKQALRALADGLRAEVNDDGVRVLSVFPGRTATAMQEGIHGREGKAYHPEHLLQPEDVAMAVMAALDMPRTAELTDIILRPMRKA
ncbi:hypothetical protein OO17_08175 [Rhodopseudomonas palustris]|uniref:Short-chain dehydrogenase n=1 Tax=Rhodopseudomonas palustris TaxID=1076 RepID=A0A0D7F0L9_RHOPL|nr:hypothetical protein OO17_08175 [Rhodopseudomonas palustris]